jgi:hypothetical protein
MAAAPRPPASRQQPYASRLDWSVLFPKVMVCMIDLTGLCWDRGRTAKQKGSPKPGEFCNRMAKFNLTTDFRMGADGGTGIQF